VGVRAINGLLTLGRGQRVGLMAGSGVGKSVLLGLITRQTVADVVVVGLIGERGREVREFIDLSLGAEGLARSVVVCAPADESLMRLRATELCHAIAAHYRDQGLHVLLLVDSLTRYAMARREVALALGEPPATRGYPPSVFGLLPQLVESAGNGEHPEGSMSAIYTVLAEGDDQQDPVVDTARAILDGHIVLTRELAERGHYPAIDIALDQPLRRPGEPQAAAGSRPRLQGAGRPPRPGARAAAAGRLCGRRRPRDRPRGAAVPAHGSLPETRHDRSRPDGRGRTPAAGADGMTREERQLRQLGTLVDLREREAAPGGPRWPTSGPRAALPPQPGAAAAAGPQRGRRRARRLCRPRCCSTPATTARPCWTWPNGIARTWPGTRPSWPRPSRPWWAPPCATGRWTRCTTGNSSAWAGPGPAGPEAAGRAGHPGLVAWPGGRGMRPAAMTLQSRARTVAY
jgi:hypothetical protein